MNSNERKCLKAIVRRVHPDLFSAHPYERTRNSESLKVLNGYVSELARWGRTERSATVEFWVKESSGELSSVTAQLPAGGSLGPLFFAFGLITAEELRAGAGSCNAGGEDAQDFLAWLQETVGAALRAAEAHDALRRLIRGLRDNLEQRYGLAAIQVGGEVAVSTAEQKRQVAALHILEGCLSELTAGNPSKFEGLTIRLYHPDSCPADTLYYSAGLGGAGLMQSHVADDGVLHIVAERAAIAAQVARLDLARARLMTRLSQFWLRRVKELAPAVAEALGLDAVWCDGRSEEASQRFVLWAGAVLEYTRMTYGGERPGRRLSFSLLLHTDDSCPLLDFLPASAVLQVRADCPPARLLECLAGEAGDQADTAAANAAASKAQEQAMLDAVRDALGAKHVIRVCSSHDQAGVMAALQRLLEAAPGIRSQVSLAGASLAIDDCYELWESGFISIPFNFRLSELQPQLRQLLGQGASSSSDGTLLPGGTAEQAEPASSSTTVSVGSSHATSRPTGNGSSQDSTVQDRVAAGASATAGSGAGYSYQGEQSAPVLEGGEHDSQQWYSRQPAMAVAAQNSSSNSLSAHEQRGSNGAGMHGPDPLHGERAVGQLRELRGVDLRGYGADMLADAHGGGSDDEGDPAAARVVFAAAAGAREREALAGDAPGATVAQYEGGPPAARRSRTAVAVQTANVLHNPRLSRQLQRLHRPGPGNMRHLQARLASKATPAWFR